MALELDSLHTADRYPLSVTTDDMGGEVETLGTKEATLSCRFAPIDVADRERYGIIAESEAYRVVFFSDPSLTNAKALVWNSKVWRVRGVVDSGGVGRVWSAVVEHVPQIELAAP